MVEKNLIDEFAKVIVGSKEDNSQNNTGVYGTIETNSSGAKVVRLDGSNTTTPIYEAMDCEEGDRVLCAIKDHRLVVTGNLSYPASARKATAVLNIVEGGAVIGNIGSGNNPSGYYLVLKDDGVYVCKEDGIAIAKFNEPKIQLLNVLEVVREPDIRDRYVNFIVDNLDDVQLNGKPIWESFGKNTLHFKQGGKRLIDVPLNNDPKVHAGWDIDIPAGTGLNEEFYLHANKHVYFQDPSNISNTSPAQFEIYRCGDMVYFSNARVKAPGFGTWYHSNWYLPTYFRPIRTFINDYGQPTYPNNIRFQIDTDGRISVYRYGPLNGEASSDPTSAGTGNVVFSGSYIAADAYTANYG